MDIAAFARGHVAQITATAGLVTYALARNKLTAGGIVAGVAVAVAHMVHPYPAFFWLLIVFFLLGTVVTRIGHTAKAHLTQAASGGSGGEGARTSAQVFANSGFAAVLILLHAYLLSTTPFISLHLGIGADPYAPTLLRLLPIGIIAQYSAVAADTFSSELGILSRTQPFLITNPVRRVPKGTNGGVTIEGFLFGALGGLLLTVVAAGTLRLSSPHVAVDTPTMFLLTLAGLVGSAIDSLLGAVAQATVTDKTTGRVVEGAGGQRVQVEKGGSREQRGLDLLTNNGVNFAMAALTGLLAMGVAWELDLGV